MHTPICMSLGFTINYPIIHIEFFWEKIDTQLIAVGKNKTLQAIIENIFIKGRIIVLR